MEQLARHLEKILFGVIRPDDKRAMNKWADIDHLIGHMCARRDIFVTWDKGILKKQAQLNKRFGIVVETPEELISRFSEQ